MKKICRKLFLSLLLSAALCVCASAYSFAAENSVTEPAAADEPEAEDAALNDEALSDFLVAESISLTCLMDELAGNEYYLNLNLGSSDEKIDSLFAAISAEDYSAPVNGAVITVSDEAVNEVFDLYVKTTSNELNLSEDAYKYLLNKIIYSVPAMINGRAGEEAIIVSSVLSVGRSYVKPEGFSGQTYVILLYEDFTSVTMFFSSGEDVISADTLFLFLQDDFKELIRGGNIMDELNKMLGDESVQAGLESLGVDIEALVNEGVAIEYLDS